MFKWDDLLLIIFVIFSRFPFDLSKPLAMYQIPYRNISAWSELKTHPGFMGKAIVSKHVPVRTCTFVF